MTYPTAEKFAITLSELGISKKSYVVIYDDSNGSNAAARFWWMLKAVGHEKVQVLNGGFREAKKIYFPTNSGLEKVNNTEPYKIQNWTLPLSDIYEVEKVSQNNKYTVIDVRENERYKGDKETIDLVAGHIPGAINIPFSENLIGNELFLSSNELKS